MMMRSLRTGVMSAAIAGIAVAGTSRAAGDSFLEPGRAAFVWKGPDTIDGQSVNRLWEKVCSAIGREMTVGKGPLGAGVFSQVTCVEPGGEIPKDVRWRVVIRSGEDAFALSVRYMLGDATVVKKESDERFLLVSRLDLPPSKTGLKGLVSDSSSELVAMRLMDGMPVGWWFGASTLSSDGKTIKGGPMTKSIEKDKVPEDVALYRLRLDVRRGLWIPVFAGRAKLSSTANGTPVWTLPPRVAGVIKKSGMWAKSWEGRNAYAQDYELAIRKSYEPAAGVGTSAGDEFSKSAIEQGSRFNRIGARYGMSFLPGYSLIRKQKLIGVFCDLQHGPMAGWRLFVDRVPKTTANQDGADVNIGSDRYLVGFSLAIAPGFFVQRVDITPRIGYWSMKAVVPVSQDATTGETKTSDFDVSRAGSGGVEAGIELGDGSNAFRLWYSLDRGVNLIGSSKGSAKATRWGVDLFIPLMKVGRLGETDIRLLGQFFGFLESISLASGTANASSSVVQVGSVDYQDAFIGGGIGVTW